MVVNLPTNLEKDWPTLLPDCFAWYSHRQALNNTEDHNMKGYMLKYDKTWTRVLYLLHRVHTYSALSIETF